MQWNRKRKGLPPHVAHDFRIALHGPGEGLLSVGQCVPAWPGVQGRKRLLLITIDYQGPANASGHELPSHTLCQSLKP